MAWQTPKTNWKTGDIPLAGDFNRIEGNIQELQNTKETPVASAKNADMVDNLHATDFPRRRAGASNIWVQSSQPTAQATGDIWIQI